MVERRGLLRRVLAAAALTGVLVALAGCGEGGGVAAGATLRAYVVPPLCAEAEDELEREDGRASDLHVDAICLRSVERRHHLKLAVIGANARRATEDSTAIAFLEAPGKANGFSHPILESAEIPLIASSSGKAAMARLLEAVERASGSGSLRSALSDELE